MNVVSFIDKIIVVSNYLENIVVGGDLIPCSRCAR